MYEPTNQVRQLKMLGPCEVCGAMMSGLRVDKTTCSVKCRKARSRIAAQLAWVKKVKEEADAAAAAAAAAKKKPGKKKKKKKPARAKYVSKRDKKGKAPLVTLNQDTADQSE